MIPVSSHDSSTDLGRLDDIAPTHVLDAENDDVGPSSCEVDVTGPPAASAGPTAVTRCCPPTGISYMINTTVVVGTYRWHFSKQR